MSAYAGDSDNNAGVRIMTGKRETKILATLGPSSMSMEVMRALIRAGSDGFRINMGHLNADELVGNVRAVRKATAKEGRPVAVVVDLGGPKIRVGTLPGKQKELVQGDELILGSDIPVSHPDILEDIRVGHRILMDDGKLELEVTGTGDKQVKVRVKTGGLLLEEKGVNLPDTDLRLPALTGKDLADIAAVVQSEADYMSLSFVQRADDILEARREAEKHGRCPRLIAKIEKPKAVERFEDILQVSDGIMIARGDLGVEMSPARVPVLQKEFIRRANAAGKTVITATQMLESMINNPRPTRAEASDVANAVWDGTDTVMLSGETAVGRYPIEAVCMMREIIVEAEKAASPRHEPFHGRTRIHALASAAVNAAADLQVSAIVAITVSGFTAQMLAQQRPMVPLIAAVPDAHVQNCMALLWGTTPLTVPWSDNSDEFIDVLERELIKSGYVRPQDTIILVSGSTKLRGIDYIMKIHEIGARAGGGNRGSIVAE